MKVNQIIMGVIILVTLSSCNMKKEKIVKQSDFYTPPVAAVKPDTFVNFNTTRIDNYFWMKDKNNSEVIDYLNAENKYTAEVMANTKDLQNKLYEEILGRVKEDNETYPMYKNGYYYYSRTEKGKQYRTYCRKKGSLDAEEEILFDVNKLAEGKGAFIFGGYDISPDNNKVAYLYNETGSYAEFIMKVKDLTTGEDLDIQIDGVSSTAWANDNNTLFYCVIDDALRPYKVCKRQINGYGEKELFEEKDARFNVGVYTDAYYKYVIIHTTSTTTSERFLLSADNPDGQFESFRPRVQDVNYWVTVHKDGFYIRYKDKDNINGKLYYAKKEDYKNEDKWVKVLDHDKDALIQSVNVLNDYVVIEFKRNGLDEFMIKSFADGSEEFVSFPEPVYSANVYSVLEPDSTYIFYSYTSLNRPQTIYKHDIKTKKSEIVKVQEVPSGFNPDDYVVERLWADANDGVKVPMAIVYKKGLKKDGSNPALIYSYGSYGSTMDPYFSTSFYSLIDRGFVYALAQIRGGSDLGEQWYEDGKLLKKKNTFTDFIACSEKLIKDGYTSADKLAAMGGSAGGLLMGAVVNMRPDLYKTVIAQVPFVDVINTMLDESLPLTVGEYEEWGNPNDEEYFNYMLSYSPYDNIKAQDYPNIMVTGGINDSQVLFHEPTKYVAKLRKMKTDDNILVLHMDMESGHGGATGRYSRIKDTAFEFAFILNRIGIFS